MPRMAPVTLARAGAMTTLNRIGVMSCTTISRGVWAESAKRRLVSVASGVVSERAAGRGSATRGRVGGAVVMAVIGLLLSKSGSQAATGEAQVHVVQGRRAGADAAGGDVEVRYRGHRLTRRTVMDGN